MTLDSIMTKKCVVNDAEVTDLIIGAEEDLKEIKDILDFLLVQNVSDHKQW